MKFYIHSSFGVLEATPLTIQAIENSIPEGEVSDKQEETEVAEESTPTIEAKS